MAGNHTLGTIRGTIEIDYDGAGIVKAVRDTEKAKSSMERLGSGSDKVLSAFGKFSRGAVALAGGIGTVYNALTLVTGALAVAGPLAAAGFAAAPGVILAYASVMGIAKIAVAGVGKALGAAGESSEKFEKAIEKLSPKAQAFARAFRDAYPQLVKIKNAMQDAFFNGSVGQVGAVVDRISQLKGVATGVAGELGRVARSTVEWATSTKSIAGMKTLLAGVQAFLRQIRASIGPVVQAFIGLGAQLGVFGATMGGAVNGALARFAEFLNGINLQEVFATALPIVKALGTFFGDVAEIAGHLFSMFNVDGANAVGILGELASKLADFLGSAEGQAALQALGQAIQAIAGAAGQIFLALLQALAPAIVALAPGVAQLAGQIAGVLVPAINALNPALTALAGFLSQNMGWLGPVAGAVVAAAAAYKVYAAAVTAVAAVQRVLNSAMLVATAGWIKNTAAVVANRIAIMASAVAAGIVKVATVAWTAVQWLLNSALFANPIGLVVLAIAALVAGIIYAWKNSETFRTVVLAVWGAIKVAIAAVVNWITGTVWPSLQKAWQQLASGAQTLWGWIKTAWNGIKNAIQTAINAVSTVLRAVWNGIVNFVRGYINTYRAVITAGFNAAKNVINTVMNGVRNVVRSIWSAITSFIQGQINRVRSIINGIRSIINVVRSAFASAKSAAQGQINALVSLVRSLPGRAASALGNLGGMLYAKGQSLVRGFIDGIASMIGSVRDKAASVVSAVTDFLPGSPAKKGPLSGKGYVLLRARRFMNDFAQGMQDGSQKPVAALMGAVNPISRATVPSTSRTSSGASTAPSTPGVGVGNRTYQIRIGDKAFAELVTDAVTGNPVTVNKAASEGARRSAWAGSGR